MRNVPSILPKEQGKKITLVMIGRHPVESRLACQPTPPPFAEVIRASRVTN